MPLQQISFLQSQRLEFEYEYGSIHNIAISKGKQYKCSEKRISSLFELSYQFIAINVVSGSFKIRFRYVVEALTIICKKRLHDECVDILTASSTNWSGWKICRILWIRCVSTKHR